MKKVIELNPAGGGTKTDKALFITSSLLYQEPS